MILFSTFFMISISIVLVLIDLVFYVWQLVIICFILVVLNFHNLGFNVQYNTLFHNIFLSLGSISADLYFCLDDLVSASFVWFFYLGLVRTAL